MVSDAVLEAVSGAIGSVVSLLITYPLKAGGDLVDKAGQPIMACGPWLHAMLHATGSPS